MKNNEDSFNLMRFLGCNDNYKYKMKGILELQKISSQAGNMIKCTQVHSVKWLAKWKEHSAAENIYKNNIQDAMV